MTPKSILRCVSLPWESNPTTALLLMMHWASPSAWRFLLRRFSTFRRLFSESTQRAMSVRIVSPVACIPYTMSRMNLLCGFEKP